MPMEQQPEKTAKSYLHDPGFRMCVLGGLQRRQSSLVTGTLFLWQRAERVRNMSRNSKLRVEIFLRKNEKRLEFWLWMSPALRWELMEDDDKPTKRSRAHICHPLSQGTVPSEGTKRNGEGGGAREKREMTQRLCRSVVMFV